MSDDINSINTEWRTEADDRQFLLDQIKLLSALESWTFSTKERIPDWLNERLQYVIRRLSDELLVEKRN